jgi:hypothetical protein
VDPSGSLTSATQALGPRAYVPAGPLINISELKLRVLLHNYSSSVPHFPPSKPERYGVSKVRARAGACGLMYEIGRGEIFFHYEALVLAHSFPMSH